MKWHRFDIRMHLWAWDKPRRYMTVQTGKADNGDVLTHVGPNNPVRVGLYPPPIMSVRHSGLQKEVLALYRRCVILGSELSPWCW